MNIVTPPAVDPTAILKTARNQSKNNSKLRAQLIAFSGVWLARKLDDLSEVLGPHEAMLVQKALTACGSRLPETAPPKAPPPRKPARPKIKMIRTVIEASAEPAVPLRGSALLQQVAADSHLYELLRLSRSHARAFRLMLHHNLSAASRNKVITAILMREGITSHGTLTRLLGGHLEWTEAYLRDVINATGLTAQELLVRTKPFLKN